MDWRGRQDGENARMRKMMMMTIARFCAALGRENFKAHRLIDQSRCGTAPLLIAATAALRPCSVESDFYNPPMLDIKLIRENPDLVLQRLAARGAGDEARV